MECISHKPNTNNGYPTVCRNGKREVMHRYVYKMHNGEIKEGMVIMHKCDNPLCINPKHLLEATYKENMQDMLNKKRNVSIKGRKLNLLNNKQLIEIKQMLIEGKTIKYVSEIYKVSGPTISRIKNGNSSHSEFLGGGLNALLAEKAIQEKR